MTASQPSLQDALDLGGGIGIDRRTLRGVILDERLAAEQDGFVLALFRGDLDEAERLLAAEPDTVRIRALRADVARERGRYTEAERIYRDLIAEAPSPTLTQHLGKVLFAAGDYASARACFVDALRRREREGASDDRLASSRLGIERCDEELAAAPSAPQNTIEE